jgi:CHAT domain-containing protein
VLVVDGSRGGNLPVLPEAATEVRDLRGIYQARVWSSDAGVSGDLRSEMENARIIHFAAHGVVNRANQLLSAIELGTQTKLYAHEVAEMELAMHPVVVLSACSGSESEEMRRRRSPTLADAFLAAGASAVVASSARVADRDAREFSLAFHQRLRSGMPVGAAVRDVQLELLGSGRPWMDFQVLGNPSVRAFPAR